SDEALNKDILRESKKEDTNFLHILTMQNHSPYEKEIGEMDYEPDINERYPEEKRSELRNYLQGLKASDEATKELINELDKSEEDINFLLFSDHLPKLFTNQYYNY